MQTPVYFEEVTVGGPSQQTRFSAMPDQIITRQSGQLDCAFVDENSQPFDITSLTGTDAKVVPFNTAEVPVTLGTGVISFTGEIFTLTSAGPTAGDFTLTVNGETTAVIAFNANEATVLAALEALASRSPGDFVVLLNGGSNLGDTGAIMEVQLSGSFDLTDRSLGTFSGLTPTTGITFATTREQSTVQNFYSVIWTKDTIPASYSTFDPEDRDGSIAIFIELEEAVGDYYQIYSRFNVTDGSLAGNQQTLPLTTFLLFYNPVYSYDNTTVDADPGAGKFRTNNTTVSSVTEFYIADDSEATVNMSTQLQALDVGSTVYLGNPNVKTSAALFTLNASPVNNVGYTKLLVTFNDSGTTSFTNGEFFSFTFDSLGLTNSFADGSSLNDNNGNELLEFGVVASAVNHIKVTNAATGTNPKSAAVGGDANIDYLLEAKGTGVIQNNSVMKMNSKLFIPSKGADVASATALPVLTDGNYFDITGTTTITSIGTLEIGTVVRLHFDGILTLTHNATDLVLPGAANIITAPGDEFTFVEYATGDWRCTSYALASGAAIVGGGAGNFPPSTDSSDKTGAYTVLVGDENTNIIIGSATAADFDITYDVSLWTDKASVLGVVNESAFIARVVVSNTGTMTFSSQGIDRFVSPGETIYFGGDTATNARVISRT